MNKNIFVIFVAFFFTLIFDYPSTFAQDIDAKGKNGRQGTSGANGQDGKWSGSDGGSGENGENGEHGSSAKDVNINLQVNESDLSVLEITGEIVPKESSNNQKALPIKLKKAGTIHIAAQGGNGGDAGDGGDGGNGASGSNGTGDSDGGDGGDGGRGGNGGNGGNAGDGGDIKIRIKYEDSFALKNLRYNFSAGTAGSAGLHGRGGFGGSGGSGGSGSPQMETYTDSDGNTQTRTTWSSGGSDGSSGNPGRSGISGQAGNPAEHGSIEFIVTFEDGSIRNFSEIFDLQIVSLKIEERTSPDGVFEPGEEFYISDMVVKNTGSMPTPPIGRSYMLIEPRSENWFFENNLVNSNGYIRVPVVLKPGESYTFEGPLFSFIIDDFAEFKANEEGLKLIGEQLFRASMTIVDQPFESFDKARKFTVRYPIELTTIHAAPALTPGDTSFGVLKIHNLANRSIGSLGEIERNISVDLNLLSKDSENIIGANAQYIVSESSENANQNFLLKRLEANETRNLPFVINIDENYNEEDAINIQGSLLFETIHNGEKYVQALKHTVRIVEPFLDETGSDVILITNQNTSREEITRWKNLAASLGLKIAVWNLSFYANFDVYAKYFKDRGEKPLFNLVESLKGRTAVVFGGKFNKWGSSDKVDVFNYLSYRQISSLMAEHETNFLFYKIDEDHKPKLKNLLLGAAWQEFNSPSMNDFIATFQKQEPRAFGNASLSQFANAPKLRFSSQPRVYKIDLIQYFYWNNPSERDLNKQAEAILNFLKIHDPARQFAISIHHNVRTLRPKGYFVSGKFSLGHIEVRSMPNITDNPLIFSASDDLSELQKVLIHSLHFKLRLRSLDHLMEQITSDEQSFEDKQNLIRATDSLLNSIIFDLSYELDAATFSTSIWRDQAGYRLPLHKQLAEHPFRTKLNKNSALRPLFVNFLARMHLLKHYIYTSRSLIYGYIPVTHGLTVAWFAEDYASYLKKNLFEKNAYLEGEEFNNAWHQNFKSAMESLDRQSSWYHGFYWRTSKRSAVYQYLRSITRTSDIFTTHDLWAESFIKPVNGQIVWDSIRDIEQHEVEVEQFTTEQLNQRQNTRNVSGESGSNPNDFDF